MMVEAGNRTRLVDLSLGKTSPYLESLVNRYEGLKTQGRGWVESNSARIINVESENPQKPLDIYNGLFVLLNGKMIFIGRGDSPGTQQGQVISADPIMKGDRLRWVQNGLYIPGEDPTPAPSLLGGELYLSRTDTTNRADGSGLVESWRPGVNKVSLRGRRWSTQQVAKGIEGQKDLIFGFSGGKTRIIARYRTGNIENGITSGFRMGSCTDQDPKHLRSYIASISTSSRNDIDDGRPGSEKLSWAGGNQIVFLQNGNIGLLGHEGMYTSDMQRPYLTTIREYNTKNQLVVSPFAIATTDDMPALTQTGAHGNDLQHTLFIKQIIAGIDKRGKEVSWTLVGGLRDKKIVAFALSRSPFSAPFDLQSNFLYVVPVNILKKYGLPTTKTA